MMKAWITSFFLFLLSLPLTAQVYTATAKLDTNKIRIGEQAVLTLDLRYPASVHKSANPAVKWLPFGDTLSKNIEILHYNGPDTILSSDSSTVLIKQQLTITSFDSGYWVIPPIKFYKAGDMSRPVESQAVLLEVLTVPIDTTKAFKDIAMPLDAPFTFEEALPWLLGGAGILLLAAIAYFIIRRIKNRPVEVVEDQAPLPPHLLALAELDKLEKENLWRQGQLKLYYSKLSDILRIYMESRFGINALEQTSAEILVSLHSVLPEEQARRMLRNILLTSDLVKFAKETPSPTENENNLRSARDFINLTAQVEDPEVLLKEEVEIDQ